MIGDVVLWGFTGLGIFIVGWAIIDTVTAPARLRAKTKAIREMIEQAETPS